VDEDYLYHCAVELRAGACDEEDGATFMLTFARGSVCGGEEEKERREGGRKKKKKKKCEREIER